MQSIFITGAAAGIGKACAEHFHAQGWFVGLYDIDRTGCARLADALGQERCSIGKLDVTDIADWTNALKDFWAESGQRLDVLMNNAGVLCSGEFQDIPLQHQHDLIDINIKGVMNGCHLAFEYLQQTPGACVINMASASAIYGQPELASYSSSKFFVRGFTEALQLEWQAHDIQVRDIWPLFVQTDMINDLGGAQSVKNMGVKLSPQDVARTVYQAATASGRPGRTHWPVGLPAKSFYQGVKLGPGWLSRQLVKHISKR